MLSALPALSLVVFAVAASAEVTLVDPVAATWFAGWHGDEFPLSQLSWNKYTHVTYAFAETTPDVHTLSLNGSKPELLPEFVQTAKQNGVKALISVGGWTGSRFFSSAVATPDNRTAFAKTILDLVDTYQLDGVDFDWESPVQQGIGCNVVLPSDTENFLSFLQTLRASPRGSRLIVTAAAGVLPWLGADEKPLTDVAPFANLFDYVAIMNYDIWGPWSDTTGPNGPVDDSCAPDAAQAGSATAGVATWTAAGMPAGKIVLGVPAYGHGFSVNATSAYLDDGSLNLYAPFSKYNTPAGDRWSDPAGEADVCGHMQENAGTYDFWALKEAGYILAANGTTANSTVKHAFDECSQAAVLYDESQELFIAYDDARSFEAKGAFIRERGLRGFAMWEAGGDSNDVLLDAIRAGTESC